MTSEANVILHIGAGSFHRAHQAWYLHRLNESGDTSWSLAVGNIRGDMNAVLDALAAQNGEYTLETVTPQGEREYETVRAIKKVVPWSADLAELIAVGADPTTKIVSFTVTEGGYYLDEHDKLDTANADLAADLKGSKNTIYGALAAILDARMKTARARCRCKTATTCAATAIASRRACSSSCNGAARRRCATG